MSSCLSWIVLTTPHYDSSASVFMLIASPIPWCQIVLFFPHDVKLSSDPPHCDSSALVSMLMKPRCWHRRRLEGGLICPQPLVLSKTRSDQITPNQTILCHTIHYTFMFQCIKWSLPCATISLTNNLNCLTITLVRVNPSELKETGQKQTTALSYAPSPPSEIYL